MCVCRGRDGGRERERRGEGGGREGGRERVQESKFLTLSCSGVAPVLDALSEPAKSTILSCVQHNTHLSQNIITNHSHDPQKFSKT